MSPTPHRRWPARALLLAGGGGAVAFGARAAMAWPLDPIAAARQLCVALALATVGAGGWLLLRCGRRIARGLLQRPRLLRAALAVAAAGLTLLLAEGALRAAGVFAHHSDVEVLSSPFVEPDARLGYRLVRDREVAVQLVRARDGEVTGNVRYGFDAAGHRRTVLPAADGHDRAVLFFGCSQTFGHGLDDDATVPSRYAAAMPRDLVSNLAVPGYGPNHALVLARDAAALPLPALPRAPVAVFVWIDHHLLRLCGSLRVRNAYGLDAPCFALTSDGHAELRGPFRSAEPARTAWCWALGKSQLLQLCGYDWPAAPREGDLGLAAAVFRDLAAALRTVQCRLLIAQYPNETMGARVAAQCGGDGVAFADLTGLFDPKAAGMSIDRDGHPTRAAAQLLGDRIADEVRRAFP